MNYAIVLGSIFAVHVLAIISPGQNVLIVLQTSMGRGRRAGVAVALGIATGAGIWSTATHLGLSVLFAQFAWLYRGLMLAGGMYLLYLGIVLWRAADRPFVQSARRGAAADTDRHAFRLGLFTNLTNPKAAIFYGGIFAAFLTPDLPTWVRVAAIGVIVINSTGWHVALACLFSTERARRVYGRLKPWIDRLSGSALAFLGLRLMLQGRWPVNKLMTPESSASFVSSIVIASVPA